MLPVTKAQPKEMLPLVDKPIIHYAVEEIVNSGIRQVIVVTAVGKRAVEDYFDRSRDVEELLEKKGDFERLEQLRRVSQMADFAYVRQAEPLGLADAVNTARHLVDNEPFALLLPDDVIIGDPPVTRQLVDCYERLGTSVIAVEEVPESEVSSYGIVAGETVDERVTRLSYLVEKPPVHSAPSRLAIVGRYLLTPAILAEGEGMHAYRFTGERHDTGRPLSFLIASIDMALRRPDVAPGLRAYLRELDLEGES
jgi:UTP--glucose-1-phosphate uridylyltransferase